MKISLLKLETQQNDNHCVHLYHANAKDEAVHSNKAIQAWHKGVPTCIMGMSDFNIYTGKEGSPVDVGHGENVVLKLYERITGKYYML